MDNHFFDNIKYNEKFTYICKKCGKTITVQYRPCRKQIYLKQLCLKCNLNEQHKLHPEWHENAVKSNYKNHNGVYSSQTKDFKLKLSKLNLEHPEWQEKARKSTFEKYGVEYLLNDKEFNQKCIDAVIDKYGGMGFASKKIMNKSKQTKLERYGNENYTNIEKIKETQNLLYGGMLSGSKEISEKIRKTNLEKYGVESIFKSKIIQDKIKQTKINKYGSDTYTNQNKREKTNIKKYGFKTPLQNQEIRYKIIKTNIEKYGVPNVSNRRYKYDGIIFDSSWELAYWIYCKDNGFNISRESLELRYIDENNIERSYYPDFKVNDQLVEIKGNQFIDEFGNLTTFKGKTLKKILKNKQKCMSENNVKLILNDDIKPYLNYVNTTYGNQYMRLFILISGYMSAMYVQKNLTKNEDIFTPFNIDIGLNYQKTTIGFTPFDIYPIQKHV